MNSRFFYALLVIICLVSIETFSQNNDADMQQIIAEKRSFNQTNNKTDGYRIQLYNGLSENIARSTQSAFAAYFPEISTKLFYEQPEWKVQTRPFKTKFDAYKVWLKIRKEFNSTFIFESKE